MIQPAKRIVLAHLAMILMGILCFGMPAVEATPIPVPYIGSISPVSVAPGGAAFTLTVNGTGFLNNSVVDFGTTALATTYVSGTQVTAAVPATLIATSGSRWITVTNPGTPDRISNMVFAQVGAPSAALNFAGTAYTAQDTTIGVAQADFNGDGNLDLAVSNYSTESVSIFLGNGDGTFQAAQNISLSGAKRWPVRSGDRRFQQRWEYRYRSGLRGQQGISILLGNGDGTFQTPQTVTAGNYALGTDYWGFQRRWQFGSRGDQQR